MGKKYVLSIDSSSSACKTSLIDLNGAVIRTFSIPIETHRPYLGWCEYDALEIWEKQLSTIQGVIKGIDPQEIIGIGITNQRETVVAWDLDSKKPICRAISWQDSRTKDFLRRYEKFNDLIKEKTGLCLSVYFSASKIQWILKNTKFNLDTLRVGTIDSWLIFNLTNYEVHATDLTNASRTLLCNLDTEDWDKDLLDLFEIPRSTLPEIKSSGDLYGFWEYEGFRIPIYGVIGDQQASLLSGAFDRGSVKCTYGTGLFFLANLGTKKEYLDGTVTTIAWKIFNEKTFYALECGSFICGNLVSRLFDDGLFKEYVIENLSIEDLIFLKTFDERIFIFDEKNYPDLVWNLGSMDTIGEKTLKGAINAIALVARELFLLIKRKIDIHEVCISGELTKLSYLRNIQKLLFDVNLVGLNFENHSMLGAAYLVMIATKHKTFEEIREIVSRNLSVYKSDLELPKDSKLLERWEAYKSSL